MRAYDALGLGLAAVLAALACPQPAYAYIDPSVMTYTIQALAGAAVALSAVFGVAWRRGRRALARLLDIDPEAHRQREGEVHRVHPGASWAEPASPAAGEACAVAMAGTGAAAPEKTACLPASPASGEADTLGIPASAAAAADGRAPDAGSARKRRFLDGSGYNPPWRIRLGVGALVAFFLVFTVFYAAPLEIVAGAANSLIYGVSDIWWVPLLPDAGIVLVLALVLSAFRGRAFSALVSLVFALGFCAYLQALALNGGLPAADGAAIHWGDYMAWQVASAVIWAVIVLGFVLYGLHRMRRAQGIAILGSCCLAAVQAIALAATLLAPGLGGASDDPAAAPRAQGVVTEEGLYTVSGNGNVIMFVLDTFDDAYLKRILKTDPALLDEFTGFTSYENCTGSLIPTRFALPQMLTGQMPSFDEPFSAYVRERYNRGTFLEQIQQAGYSIGLYTDSLTLGDLPASERAAVTGKTVNVHGLPASAMDYGRTLYSLYQMALYRDMPWALKWAFWYYTDQMNAAYAQYDPQAAPEETIYVMDDVRYYQRLMSKGLSVEDDGAGAFRMIHLLGSHYPFNYDENVAYLGQDESDVFRQSRGVLAIVSEYLRQLKALGLYDQATIIVTADHGYWTITEEPLEDTSNPIMFVKPPETAEQAAQPLAVDDKPVSQLDLQATVLDVLGLDWSEYAQREEFPGYSMLGPIDEDRVRRYLTTDSEPDLSETQLREYEIDGNALDLDNWRETGRTIDARQ